MSMFDISGLLFIPMNPCPTPPVCEFGEYGPRAVWWSPEGDGYKGWRSIGEGGVYGMCGHRPLTAWELGRYNTRGDRMGQRPEVDRVNVVPCDGARRLRGR